MTGAAATGGPRVGFLVTCLVDTFYPRVGMAAAAVLEHLGCRVVFPEGQTCCGQPFYTAGLPDEARALLLRLPDLFPEVDHVVSPSGSCASLIRLHARHLCTRGTEVEKRLLSLAERTWEFTAFLRDVLGVTPKSLGLSPEEKGEGEITYHYPCHLRGLLDAESARSTCLDWVQGARVALDRFDQCCGFGGVFSVESPEISQAMLEDKLGCLQRSGARTLVCNEGGCALQIGGGLNRAGRPVRIAHVAELIAERLGVAPERGE